MMLEKRRGYFSIDLCFLLFFLMSEIRLATLNVNGARDIRKRALLKEIIKQKNIDVIFLQETHSDGQNATEWEREFEGISILSNNTSTSAGVAILFTKNFSPISYDFEEIVKGRLLKVRAVFENYTLVFLCVYVPTSVIERMLFLDTLCCTLQNSSSEEF